MLTLLRSSRNSFAYLHNLPLSLRAKNTKIMKKKDHLSKNEISKMAPGAVKPPGGEPAAEATRTRLATRTKALHCRIPNRDKKKKIKWTYEFNKDSYDCYIEADRDRLGYTERMKNLWDRIHPDPDVSSKYLRTQVIRIISKKLIKETQDNHQNNASTNAPQMVVTDAPSGFGNIAQAGDDPTELEVNTEPSTLTDSNRIDQEEDNYTEFYIPEEIQRELKEKWNENFETYREINIPQRNYQTKFHASMTDQEWTLIDNIVEHKVQELKNNGGITLWDITSPITSQPSLLSVGKATFASTHNRRNLRNQDGWHRLRQGLLQ